MKKIIMKAGAWMSELSESIRLAGQSLQNANMSLLNAALEMERLENMVNDLEEKSIKHENFIQDLKALLDKYAWHFIKNMI